MHTLKTTKIVSAAFISLVLSACGGGAGDSPLSSGGGVSSSSVSSGVVDTTSPTFIGFGFDNSFVAGQIGVSIGDAILSPGGSTNLTVNIVSSTKTLASSPVEITFNSPCIASGEAKLSVNNAPITGNKVTSNFGEVTVTYTANGCTDTDQVTATAVLKNAPAVAKTTLKIASDAVQSLTALDPSRTQISLKGTGGPETAIVSFKVSGPTGAPIKDKTVDFTLSNEAGGPSLGGLTLVNESATTTKDGIASTTVQAGNVATSVVITAKERETGIAATSKKLTVSTGIPDQDSFSISATELYPMGWDNDGIESTINVRLADAFNNPAIDGTAVSFTAEGGSIDPSCPTTGGACSVKWRSQSPRPERDSSDSSITALLCVNPLGKQLKDEPGNPALTTCRRQKAGRVTILAHAIGNESFIDNNGNGLYDFGTDTFKTHEDYQPLSNPECDKAAPLSSLARPSNSPKLACDDLVEAYLDRNENGVRDTDEIFIDLNLDSNPSFENGIYNGVLCRDNNPNCTNKEKITIRGELVLVMVSDELLIEDIEFVYPPAPGGTLPDSRFPFLARVVHFDALPSSSSSGSSSSSPATSVITGTSASFWLADQNGNGVPAGTTIKLDTAELKNATAKLSTEGPLSGSPDPTLISISFSADDSGKEPRGSVIVTVTYPVPGGTLSVSDTIFVNDKNVGPIIP